MSPEVNANPELKAKLEAVDIQKWFLPENLPTWREGNSPLTLAPDYEKYLFHGWRDDVMSDQWRQCGLYTKGFLDQFADVPVMLICSWWV